MTYRVNEDSLLARMEQLWKRDKTTGKVELTLNQGGVVGVRDMKYSVSKQYLEAKPTG